METDFAGHRLKEPKREAILREFVNAAAQQTFRRLRRAIVPPLTEHVAKVFREGAR
jgi:hypothetical protein